MRKIFVINGLPRSGKTTFGLIVKELLNEIGIPFQHISSITPIKHLLFGRSNRDPLIISDDVADWLYGLRDEIVREYGLDAEWVWKGESEKNATIRAIMSSLKARITQEEPDFISLWILREVERMSENSVTFIDIREPENINRLREVSEDVLLDYEIKTVLVDSNQFDSDFLPGTSDAEVMNIISMISYLITQE